MEHSDSTRLEDGGGYVALKSFALSAKRYVPGQRVDVRDIPAHKLGQLLDQRFLAPSLALVTT